MKSLVLPLFLAVAAIAQTPPQIKPPVAQPIGVNYAPGGIPGTDAAAALSRFDLDFPGGTPGDLVDAIGHSMAKKINVVIADDGKSVRLPAVRVRNATVNDVFTAIAVATRREVAVPTSIAAGMRSGGPQTIQYQYRTVQSQFQPAGNQITDDTVWSFVTNEPDVTDAAARGNQPTRELRHFQLRDYISDSLSVADITTAIRSGWEMLGIKNPPDLKFHQETGIMIAAGEPQLLDQIPMVLQQLPRNNAIPGAQAPAMPGGLGIPVQQQFGTPNKVAPVAPPTR